MPTYLTDAAHGTPLHEIHRCWNAGWEKARVLKELVRRHGDGHEALLDSTWGKLEAEFGECGMPIIRPRNGLSRVEKLKRELADEPASSMRRDHIEAYLRWKGEIGQGAMLREILAEVQA